MAKTVKCGSRAASVQLTGNDRVKIVCTCSETMDQAVKRPLVAK
jgi:hypothetical protein